MLLLFCAVGSVLALLFLSKEVSVNMGLKADAKRMLAHIDKKEKALDNWYKETKRSLSTSKNR